MAGASESVRVTIRAPVSITCAILASIVRSRAWRSAGYNDCMAENPTEVPVPFLDRLRFPHLFLLLGGLFFLDLFIPDFVPLIDELILGILTVMMGVWRKSRSELAAERQPVEKNITPSKSIPGAD